MTNGMIGLWLAAVLCWMGMTVPLWAQEPKGAAQPVAAPIVGPAPASKPQNRLSTGLTPAEPTLLEDILLEKGVISIEDWTRIKAEEEQRAALATAEQGIVSNPRWYERIRIAGYVQTRYSVISNGKCDISLSDSNACNNPQKFYFRRIRMPISGQVSDRLFFYLQPAFEGDGFNTGNSVDLVDAFADYLLTKDREFRFRFGMHRVLNAFDTFRTSSQRQELDRHESIQSGAPGERDLGISFYWTPTSSQMLYQQLTQYHNGPGDYGNFALQIVNGQGRNKIEQNADKMVAVRLAHPFELPNGRLFEIGTQAYHNQFVATNIGSPTSTAATRCKSALKTGSSGSSATGGCQVLDERISAYFWTPPQPWGIMMEGTIGRGPQRDQNGILRETALHGGYIQGNYTWRYSDTGIITPYVRWGEYYGGNKNSQGVSYLTRNVNAGLVWEPDTHWRFVAEYLFKHGNNQQSNGGPLAFNQPQDTFNASIIRFQAQWLWN